MPDLPCRVRLPVLAAVILGLAGGCIPLSLNQGAASTSEPPENVLDRALVVFGQYAIPVDHTTMPDRVESGVFEVQNQWGGVPVEGRVDCGTTHDGEPVARVAVVELQIRFRARLVGNETRTSLASYGRTVRGRAGESRRCQLRPEFSQELFAAIVGGQTAGRGWPPGKPGELPPPRR